MSFGVKEGPSEGFVSHKVDVDPTSGLGTIAMMRFLKDVVYGTNRSSYDFFDDRFGKASLLSTFS